MRTIIVRVLAAAGAAGGIFLAAIAAAVPAQADPINSTSTPLADDNFIEDLIEDIDFDGDEDVVDDDDDDDDDHGILGI